MQIFFSSFSQSIVKIQIGNRNHFDFIIRFLLHLCIVVIKNFISLSMPMTSADDNNSSKEIVNSKEFSIMKKKDKCVSDII